MPTYRRSSQPAPSRGSRSAAEPRPTAPRPPLVRPVTLNGLEEHTSTDLRAGAYADLTRFAGAGLAGSDLTGAALSRVAVEGTRVGTLALGGARLADVDLRGAVLERVDDVAGLRGATVSTEQLTALAPLMAEHLGLRVIG